MKNLIERVDDLLIKIQSLSDREANEDTQKLLQGRAELAQDIQHDFSSLITTTKLLHERMDLSIQVRMLKNARQLDKAADLKKKIEEVIEEFNDDNQSIISEEHSLYNEDRKEIESIQATVEISLKRVWQEYIQKKQEEIRDKTQIIKALEILPQYAKQSSEIRTIDEEFCEILSGSLPASSEELNEPERLVNTVNDLAADNPMDLPDDVDEFLKSMATRTATAELLLENPDIVTWLRDNHVLGNLLVIGKE